MSTPTERGDLAEQMLPVAALLSCIVHGDGDWHDIDWCTHQLDRTELVGLVVVLAAMVDPDQRIDDALGYITWDEQGRPAPALANGNKTIRGLASGVKSTAKLGADAMLESERRLLARRLYLHDGLTVTEVARAIGAAERTVKQWRDAAGWRQAPAITEADARPSRRRKTTTSRSAA